MGSKPTLVLANVSLTTVDAHRRYLWQAPTGIFGNGGDGAAEAFQ
jgi:hypothetical protein